MQPSIPVKSTEDCGNKDRGDVNMKIEKHKGYGSTFHHNFGNSVDSGVVLSFDPRVNHACLNSL